MVAEDKIYFEIFLVKGKVRSLERQVRYSRKAQLYMITILAQSCYEQLLEGSRNSVPRGRSIDYHPCQRAMMLAHHSRDPVFA